MARRGSPGDDGHAGAGQGRVRRQIVAKGGTLSAGGLPLGVAGDYALGRDAKYVVRPDGAEVPANVTE